jgi:hypothetical protein
MKEFVSALAQVRKAHDLLFDSNGGATALFGESGASDSSRPPSPTTHVLPEGQDV